MKDESQKSISASNSDKDSWDYESPAADDQATENLQEAQKATAEEETKAADSPMKEQDAGDFDKTNWVPLHLRRPEDEFLDLSTIEPVRTEQLAEDGSLELLTTTEGSGSLPEAGDTIYYKHQTRFDNGQLVDFEEKRKCVDMVIIDHARYLTYLNQSFKVMRLGQTAWLKIGAAQH